MEPKFIPVAGLMLAVHPRDDNDYEDSVNKDADREAATSTRSMIGKESQHAYLPIRQNTPQDRS